jgi:hypothetical protein
MSLAAVERKIAELEAQMKRAAEAEDFETAARLRNEIAAMRGLDAGGSALVRKPPPGEMGLGGDIPVVERPKNWRPPKKPSPLTKNVKGRRR